MRLRISACATAVALACGVALAGGGGKIKWRPGKDHDAVLAEAKTAGVPVMLYFTGEGLEACKKLDADVFSDQKIVAAMEEFGRVIIDNQQDKELFAKYTIDKTPTVQFLDYDGKPVGRMATGAQEVAISQIRDVMARHTRGPEWASDVATALAAGKKDFKPVVLVYHDAGAKSMALLKVFRDATFTPELLGKCVFAKTTFQADSEETKKLEVKEAPTLVILDAGGEGEPNVIKKATSAKAADLRKSLEAAIKKLDKAKAAKEKEEAKTKAKKK